MREPQLPPMTKEELRQYLMDRRNGFLRLRGPGPKGPIRFKGFVPDEPPELSPPADRPQAPERGDDSQDAA
jgi:hypothetical protein